MQNNTPVEHGLQYRFVVVKTTLLYAALFGLPQRERKESKLFFQQKEVIGYASVSDNVVFSIVAQ